jgi:hypothetical protein
MEGDRHKIEESGAVFRTVDLGGQRTLSLRHIFRALVEAGCLIFVVDKLTCSLR